MASSEESLAISKRNHVHSEGYNVLNHHIDDHGRHAECGCFKYVFEFGNHTGSSIPKPGSRHLEPNSASSLQLAPRSQRPIRIAVVGNYLPRQCGIATFTTDLCNAIAAEYGTAQLSVVAINDGQSSYLYPERVRFEISEGDLCVLQSGRRVLECGRSRSGVLTA